MLIYFQEDVVCVRPKKKKSIHTQKCNTLKLTHTFGVNSDKISCACLLKLHMPIKQFIILMRSKICELTYLNPALWVPDLLLHAAISSCQQTDDTLVLCFMNRGRFGGWSQSWMMKWSMEVRSKYFRTIYKINILLFTQQSSEVDHFYNPNILCKLVLLLYKYYFLPFLY